MNCPRTSPNLPSGMWFTLEEIVIEPLDFALEIVLGASTSSQGNTYKNGLHITKINLATESHLQHKRMHNNYELEQLPLLCVHSSRNKKKKQDFNLYYNTKKQGKPEVTQSVTLKGQILLYKHFQRVSRLLLKNVMKKIAPKELHLCSSMLCKVQGRTNNWQQNVFDYVVSGSRRRRFRC